LRDRMVDAEFVTELRRALGDKESYVRSSAIEIFTAAIAQRAPTSVFRVFILKYLQTVFGTRYLLLRSSMNSDVHWVITIPTSDAGRSKYSELR
jgi:hypothetical protein